VRYRVQRTFLDAVAGESTLAREKGSQIVEAESAVEAARLFIADDTCRLVGSVQPLPGDEATATCQSGGKLYVITVRPEVSGER
jgi:hypothetical protein